MSLSPLCAGLHFQLIDHPVGATQPSTQLAAQVREQLNGDRGSLLGEHRKLRLAQCVGDEIVVGDDRCGPRTRIEDTSSPGAKVTSRISRPVA